MKKYIKQNNTLSPIIPEMRVLTATSDIQTNEIALVKNKGLYYKDAQNTLHTVVYHIKGGDTPIGTIKYFYGDTIPSGYLECNGATFSASSYPELYDVLGTTTLPDFRECYAVGYGPTVGNTGNFSDDAIFPHQHIYSVSPHTHSAIQGNHCHGSLKICFRNRCFGGSGTICNISQSYICNDCTCIGVEGYCDASWVGVVQTATDINVTVDSAIAFSTCPLTVDNVSNPFEIGVRVLIYAGV